MTGTGRPKKKIGELNGWASSLFRVQLVATPIMFAALVSLGTWLVRSVNELSQAQAISVEKITRLAEERYTSADSRADQLQLRADILSDVAQRYPPQYLVNQVARLEDAIEKLEAKSP
jgi:uncharacterized membrane protein